MWGQRNNAQMNEAALSDGLFIQGDRRFAGRRASHSAPTGSNPVISTSDQGGSREGVALFIS